ncbi:MAG TPA: RluA family pseudouridine synthase [Polyangiaceae bacterium]|nr:RluA family pseudouridine synthase [Polyangiaceae bacterium]
MSDADETRSSRAAQSFSVSDELAGLALDRALRTLLEGESWGKVRRFIETGKVRLDGEVVTELTRFVRKGQTIALSHSAPRPQRPGLSSSAIVYADTHVVVVEKPAGLSTVPFDENETVALDQIVAAELSRRDRGRRPPLGVVHRLDKDTTGLVVFARSVPAKRVLKNQFRFHTVKRRYWAIAHGVPAAGTLSSRLVPDRGDGLRGSTDNPTLGRPATTHVKVLERLSGASWLECRLETGRTHQIRIHLAESGCPLLGERVYIRGYKGSITPAPRVMLHAFELGFEHPVSGLPLAFESRMPADMTLLLNRLRAR